MVQPGLTGDHVFAVLVVLFDQIIQVGTVEVAEHRHVADPNAKASAVNGQAVADGLALDNGIGPGSLA